MHGKIAVFGFLTFFMIGSDVAAQQVRTDQELQFSLSVPETWRPLSECPKGYPQYNFRFGWKRAINKAQNAVIIATVWPIDIRDKSKVTLEFIGNTARYDFQAGGSADELVYQTVSGRRAVFATGNGSGDGTIVSGRLGNVPTKQRWCIFLMSKEMAIRIQFAAPAAAFDVLYPDYQAALSTLVFGPGAVAKIPNGGISDEQLQQALTTGVLAAPQSIPIAPADFGQAAGTSQAATPNKENSLLSSEQWESLQVIAKRKNLTLGALLRQIVDEFIRKEGGIAANGG